MQLLIMSEAEARKFIEAQQLERIRIGVIRQSIEEAKDRADRAHLINETAKRLYFEALLILAPDDNDDFATAIEKAQKYERIEEEYISAGAAYEHALTRYAWELHIAEKTGVQ